MRYNIFYILFLGLIFHYYFVADRPVNEQIVTDNPEVIHDPPVVEKASKPKKELRNIPGKEENPEPNPTYDKDICNGASLKFNDFLQKYARQMEDMGILYNSEALSDCSGIFLRLCASLQKQCPDVILPSASKARDTRALSRWFHKRDRLQIVKNAAESGRLIKPGAVMFYGTVGVRFSGGDLAIDKLATFGGIQHIGVVTDVVTDENGKVISYTLFHGRSRGKIASSTNWHHLVPSNHNYPPFGNGRQQWVAVGELF